MQATTASPAYVHTGLGDGATRYYKVAAYDGAGNQSAGQATYAVATTTIPNRVPTFNVAPTTATIASSGGTIQFTATDADGDTLTYTLPVTRTGITINSASGLVTVASSAAGTTGSITVRATDTSGAYAEASCAVTVQSASDVTAPTVPQGLTVSQAGSATLYVSWAASTDASSPITYLLDRSTDQSTWTQVYSNTTTSYTNSGLTNGTAYYYRVAARDPYNNTSAYSANASGTPTEGGGTSFVHGQPYTFNRAGSEVFGSKTTAAPILWDNITNGNYGTIVNGAVVPAGAAYLWGGDSETGTHSNVYFSTSVTRANGKPTYTANSDAGTLKNTGRARTKTGYAYVSWWFRPNTVPWAGDHSSKLLRMSDSRNLELCTFSETQQQTYIYDTISAGGYVLNEWRNGFLANASWNFCEASFATATRRFVLRVNGADIINTTWSAGNFDPNILWMLGWDSGGTSPVAMQWWIDCVYHDNSLARVMLGNAATYAGCTAFEMQPATAWADTSITITANRGAATIGSTRYLYVINSSDAVVNSSGYAVTVS